MRARYTCARAGDNGEISFLHVATSSVPHVSGGAPCLGPSGTTRHPPCRCGRTRGRHVRVPRTWRRHDHLDTQVWPTPCPTLQQAAGQIDGRGPRAVEARAAKPRSRSAAPGAARESAATTRDFLHTVVGKAGCTSAARHHAAATAAAGARGHRKRGGEAPAYDAHGWRLVASAACASEGESTAFTAYAVTPSSSNTCGWPEGWAPGRWRSQRNLRQPVDGAAVRRCG